MTDETTVRATTVEHAVEFLLHPKVRSASLTAKISFLRRKGLNDEEMAMALSRAHPELSSVSLHLVKGDAPSPALKAEPKPSFWTWKTIAAASGLSAVTMFFVGYFYKFGRMRLGSRRRFLLSPKQNQQLLNESAAIQDQLQELSYCLQKQSRDTKRALKSILAAIEQLKGSSDDTHPAKPVCALDDSGILISPSESGIYEEALDIAYKELIQGDRQSVKTTVNVIMLYLSKIVDNPESDASHTIDISRATYQTHVAGVPGASDLLHAVGFSSTSQNCISWGARNPDAPIHEDVNFKLVATAIEMLEGFRDEA